MPGNHSDACSESKKLCDQLLEALNRIVALERKQNGHYCDLWAGRKLSVTVKREFI